MSFLVIPIRPWGQINVKFARDSMYSERYGKVPTFALLGIRFTWRASRPTKPSVADHASR